MALAIDIVGLGVQNELATLLGFSQVTTFAAAGTTSGTATSITTSNALVTSASSSAKGVILATGVVLNKPQIVQASSANTNVITVYPFTGGAFNGGSTNGGIDVSPGNALLIYRETTTNWVAYQTGSAAASGTPAVYGQTVSPRTIAIGGLVPAVSTDFTDTAPVTTEVYFGEILVPCNMTVTGVALFNGSNVTGNVQVMLYDSAGTLVANSAGAGTAGSGTDSYQLVPFTATASIKGPATYFIASAYSSATARYNAPPLGAFATGKATGQVFGTAPATITPPTTFTANLCNIASLY